MYACRDDGSQWARYVFTASCMHVHRYVSAWLNHDPLFSISFWSNTAACKYSSSSRIATMVIDGSSPSSSVILNVYFQSHHFCVSVCSIYLALPRSFSGWFHVRQLPAGMLACSSGRLLTCPNCLSVTLLDIFATPIAPRMYSSFISSFLFTTHISTSTSLFRLLRICSPLSRPPWIIDCE